MEKFGIFELLDTLSALTSETKPPEEGQNAGKNVPSSAEEEASSSPSPSQSPVKNKAGGDALAGFYARHEAVARKADEKK